MRTMHITIPALQKRPKVLPMSLSEMLCTGTQSSGGQAVRLSVYASIMNASTTFCSPNATLRLPANSASTCGFSSWAIIASNQRAAVIETRQLLRPRLEFDGERFGVIGNGGARRAERDKGCPKDGDPAASTKGS